MNNCAHNNVLLEKKNADTKMYSPENTWMKNLTVGVKKYIFENWKTIFFLNRADNFFSAPLLIYTAHFDE